MKKIRAFLVKFQSVKAAAGYTLWRNLWCLFSAVFSLVRKALRSRRGHRQFTYFKFGNPVHGRIDGRQKSSKLRTFLVGLNCGNDHSSGSKHARDNVPDKALAKFIVALTCGGQTRKPDLVWSVSPVALQDLFTFWTWRTPESKLSAIRKFSALPQFVFFDLETRLQSSKGR